MKKAISLIELIFAIVIVGLVVSSLPTILSQANTNNIFTLKQDAIKAAQTKIKGISTHFWDERSYSPITLKSYIINTNSQNTQLNNRPGLTKLAGRRSKSLEERNATKIGKEGQVINDIDDFDAQKEKVARSVISKHLNGAKNLDYVFKNKMQLISQVRYVNDNAINFTSPNASFNFSLADATNTTSNIKRICVKIKLDDKNTISLYSYVFNIGESSKIGPRNFNP